jgi:hypothetical protein
VKLAELWILGGFLVDGCCGNCGCVDFGLLVNFLVESFVEIL